MRIKKFMMKFKYVIIHYAEIALKGDNRRFFENALRATLKRHLKKKALNFL